VLRHRETEHRLGDGRHAIELAASAARIIARVRAGACAGPFHTGRRSTGIDQPALHAVRAIARPTARRTVGCSGRNGAPKQAENVVCGSVTPRSVPATFAV